MAPSFHDHIHQRLDHLHALSTSAPHKYRAFEAWLAGQLFVDAVFVDAERVTTVYLSDLSRQFTARVGAALVSEPLVLVVLGFGDFNRPNDQAVAPVDRLARICAYVGRIQLLVVAEGGEGVGWQVRYLVGPHTSELFQVSQDLLPEAEPVPVIVPPL